MNYKTQFFNNVANLVHEIENNESEKINLAAQKIAQSTASGGIIHLFGSGHSVLSSLETYIRAGAFSNSRPVTKDMDIDRFERIPGVGKTLMGGFDGLPGEVLFIFSNSGKNPLPIEVAEVGKEKGLFCVGITSFSSAKINQQTSRNLIDVVDLAIDTHVPYGDASVDLEGLEIKMAPLSTIANDVLLHAIYCEAAEILMSMGMVPPVRISRNTPRGDAYNRKFIELFADRIPGLRY